MYAQAGYVPGTVADAPPDVRAAFIQRVYTTFFLTVMVAVGVGALVYSSPEALRAVMGMRFLLWISAFVILMITGAARHQTATNTTLLFVFAALTGAAVTPAIYIANSAAPGVAFQAAVVTSAVFGGLTLYAMYSKEDFSFLGGFLMVGLIGLIVSGIVLWFTRSPLVNMAYGCAGVLIFSGYVLYDTSRILLRYPPGAVIPAVISLYLDLLNLFLFILRILASSQRRD